MIICILKGEMPFKMHKIIFFLDLLPETLIFLFGLIDTISMEV